MYPSSVAEESDDDMVSLSGEVVAQGSLATDVLLFLIACRALACSTKMPSHFSGVFFFVVYVLCCVVGLYPIHFRFQPGACFVNPEKRKM